MHTLIKNEFRKLLRRKKTYVVFIGFLLISMLFGYANYRDEQNYKFWNDPKNRIAQEKESLKWMTEEKSRLEKDIINTSDENTKKNLQFELENISGNVENMNKSIAALEEAINKGDKDNWRAQLDLQIADMEMTINNPDNRMPEKYKIELRRNLEQLKYLKQNDIKPLVGVEFQSFNYISKSLEVVLYLIIPVLIVVLVSDFVSGECTPPTLKFLLTQPVSRRKVLLSKFICAVLSSIAAILLVQLIMFIAIGILGGFGNPNYPMDYATRYFFDYGKLDELGKPMLQQVAGSTKMITMASYTGILLFREVIFITACASFGFMISALFNSSMIAMVLSIVSAFGFTILSLMATEFKFLAKFLKYVFFTYGNIPNVIKGKLAISYNNPSITSTYGLVVTLVWIVVCYAVAHFVFTKKDILI